MRSVFSHETEGEPGLSLSLSLTQRETPYTDRRRTPQEQDGIQGGRVSGPLVSFRRHPSVTLRPAGCTDSPFTLARSHVS